MTISFLALFKYLNLDEIDQLKSQIKELHQIREDYSEGLDEQEEEINKLTKENQKLRFSELALDSQTQCLSEARKENNGLKQDLRKIIEMLYNAKLNISQFMKTFDEQDEMHTQHISWFRKSELLLKRYYENCIKTCLEQIQLREKTTASIEIQTEDTYDEDLIEKTLSGIRLILILFTY